MISWLSGLRQFLLDGPLFPSALHARLPIRCKGVVGYGGGQQIKSSPKTSVCAIQLLFGPESAD
jgi:hypothetical protein